MRWFSSTIYAHHKHYYNITQNCRNRYISNLLKLVNHSNSLISKTKMCKKYRSFLTRLRLLDKVGDDFFVLNSSGVGRENLWIFWTFRSWFLRSSWFLDIFLRSRFEQTRRLLLFLGGLCFGVLGIWNVLRWMCHQRRSRWCLYRNWGYRKYRYCTGWGKYCSLRGTDFHSLKQLLF